MASSLAQINVHIVFHIKMDGILIRVNDLENVFSFIGGIIRSHNSLPLAIGGQPDHIHILCTLPKSISLSDFIRVIKAESSKWIKTVDIHYKKFSWQNGYGAFSVSPSLVNKTIRYIQNQEEHHRKHTFHEEYVLFLEAYGIEYDKRYLFTD